MSKANTQTGVFPETRKLKRDSREIDRNTYVNIRVNGEIIPISIYEARELFYILRDLFDWNFGGEL